MAMTSSGCLLWLPWYGGQRLGLAFCPLAADGLVLSFLPAVGIVKNESCGGPFGRPFAVAWFDDVGDACVVVS